jgi:hypothetical protein
MKKILAVFLMILLSVTPVIGSDIETERELTPSQLNELQLEVDIATMCISDATYKWVQLGFTTEYAVGKGFAECKQEGDNLVATMDRLELTKEEQASVAIGLFKSFVKAIDDIRNAEALRKMKKKKPTKPSPKIKA